MNTRAMIIVAISISQIGDSIWRGWLTSSNSPGIEVKKIMEHQHLVVIVGYENSQAFPIVISEAHAEVGKTRLSNEGEGVSNDLRYTSRGEWIRDVKFTAKMVNQSSYPVTQLDLIIEAPGFFSDPLMIIVFADPELVLGPSPRSSVVDPYEVFDFHARFPIKDSPELMNRLSDFRLKVVAMEYETENGPVGWEEDIRYEFALRGIGGMTVPGPAGLDTSLELVDPGRLGKSIQDHDGIVNPASISPGDRLTTPRVTHKEKAQYTPKARAKKLQGSVVMNVVFGSFGDINSIRVVRGLPDGLTEKAVEAALKTRFTPGMKDGKPVSVSGSLEFVFRLD
jgi:TonB family protein